LRIAVISDVHGNLSALEAVLDDISHHGADLTVSLGDHLSGPFDPVGVAERFLQLAIPCVRGNHDRWLVDGREDDWVIDTLVRDAIGPGHKAWLASIPATQVVAGEVFLCHGTPSDDNTLWLDSVNRDWGSTVLPREHVEKEAEGFDFPVLLCGHSHIARTLRLADGRLVVNPGSVGLPFALGSTDARYAIIDKRAGRWSASLRAIPYDIERAAVQARTWGSENWVTAISTGWSRPWDL
jgi:putative phosphoesterase